uniref:Uncharacterized protein n=1 Tax=Geospiza parvula TaxID=87175 RepID=A0A8U8BMS5_GEOPR
DGSSTNSFRNHCTQTPAAARADLYNFPGIFLSPAVSTGMCQDSPCSLCPSQEGCACRDGSGMCARTALLLCPIPAPVSHPCSCVPSLLPCAIPAPVSHPCSRVPSLPVSHLLLCPTLSHPPVSHPLSHPAVPSLLPCVPSLLPCPIPAPVSHPCSRVPSLSLPCPIPAPVSHPCSRVPSLLPCAIPPVSHPCSCVPSPVPIPGAHPVPIPACAIPAPVSHPCSRVPSLLLCPIPAPVCHPCSCVPSLLPSCGSPSPASQSCSHPCPRAEPSPSPCPVPRATNPQSKAIFPPCSRLQFCHSAPRVSPPAPPIILSFQEQPLPWIRPPCPISELHLALLSPSRARGKEGGKREKKKIKYIKGVNKRLI